MESNILIDLSEYLRHTDIFKFILPIIDEYVRYTFKNNEELKEAVNEWCNNRELAFIKYGHIEIWNTKNITDMTDLFSSKKNFNDNVTYWDTSNVTNMNGMFCHAWLFNQPLNWDTSNVTNMEKMFSNTKSFDQPFNLNTSKVTNMNDIFHNSKKL